MMKHNAGFTLIELAVTVAIFAILSAIAIPNMINWRSNAAFRGTLNTLRTDLAVAKQSAIKHNTHVVTQFTANGYVIFVDNGVGTGGVAKNYAQDGDEQTIRQRTLPTGVTISTITFVGTGSGANTDKTVFNAKGLTPASGVGSVTLSGRKNTSTISINRVGRISVE